MPPIPCSSIFQFCHPYPLFKSINHIFAFDQQKKLKIAVFSIDSLNEFYFSFLLSASVCYLL